MSGGYAGKSKNRNNSEIQESEKSININSSMFGKKKQSAKTSSTSATSTIVKPYEDKNIPQVMTGNLINGSAHLQSQL